MTQIEMQLEVGRCNGSMSVEIADQDHMILYHWDLPDTYTVRFRTQWPNQVRIVLDNKNMSRDTAMDAQGNIVANKYVKLKSMSVGGLNISNSVLYRVCKYSPHNSKTVNEIFWDQPGTVLITLDQATPMRWNLANNNLLNFRND
jgi:hypothetical protein